MSSLVGVAAAVVSGILNGSFASPMKRITDWEWENTWLIYALTALVVLPWLIVWMTVPGFGSIWYEVPRGALLRTLLFGAGWGIGSLTFGLGLHMLGLSLGFTIMMGITAVAGSLVPMLVQDPQDLLKLGGIVILVAMVVCVIGVTFCGTAAAIRESDEKSSKRDQKQVSYKLALSVCIISGILSSMLNFAFTFGVPIATVAKSRLPAPGSDFLASNTVWLVALAGGFVPFFLYCLFLLLSKGSWRNFGRSGTGVNWLWAALMGVIWIGCITLYGASAALMGGLGTTVGWLILMSVTVVTANIWGLATGEWKGAPSKARQRMLRGVVLLIGSVILVGVGKSLLY
ncbi:MAG: L-rhamnose/proton symporter RhaT [Acidobacteriota bacterium]